MLLRKYAVLIVIAFLGIFMSKMVISAAPVFFSHLDKSLMNAVIMQLENENKGDDAEKGHVKFADHKLMFHRQDTFCIPILVIAGGVNNFIAHPKRYADPYHPSVPTPPPNLV